MIVYPHIYFTVYRLEIQFNLVSVKMSKIFIRRLHLVYKLLKITSNHGSNKGCIADKTPAGGAREKRKTQKEGTNSIHSIH